MSFFYENRKSDFHFQNNYHGKDSVHFSNHIHYHVEIIYIKQGHATAIVDSEAFDMEDDSLFVAFPNQIHGFESAAKEKYILLLFDPDLLPELAPVTRENVPSCPVIPHASHYPELLSLLNMIEKEHAQEDEAFRDSVLHGLLLAFFSKVLRLLAFEKSNSGDSHAIRAIVDYCMKNYNRELSLELLSEDLHISKYHISHLFNHKLRMRFNDYINFWRISAACRHLSQDKYSVTEVSEAVGFSTIRTFNRAFRKQTGMSPVEYRQHMLSKDFNKT